MRVGEVCNRIREVAETGFEISSTGQTKETAGSGKIKGLRPPFYPPFYPETLIVGAENLLEGIVHKNLAKARTKRVRDPKTGQMVDAQVREVTEYVFDPETGQWMISVLEETIYPDGSIEKKVIAATTIEGWNKLPSRPENIPKPKAP